MNRSKGLARAAALIVVSLVLSLAIPLFPSLATSSNDIALGTTSNFSLVSGGVIVLGASAQFTGASSIQTALVAAVDLDSPTVASYTAAGVTNFNQNTSTANTALGDAIALRSQLNSLTGVSRSAVLGNETITAGVYDALSGTAISIATPLVLDGGGDYNSIFVFRTPAAFNVAADLTIQAVNGAQPSHIFWVIAGAITIGARTNIPGTFISPAAITIGANDVINGSLLGTTAAAITIGASAAINHSTRTSTPTPTPAPAPAPAPAPSAPDPLFIPAPVLTPSPKPSPEPAPSPTPLPTPTPEFMPLPTPEPTPTPEPLPLPTEPAVVIVRPTPQVKKPVVLTSKPPAPVVIFPEVFTAIDIAPMRKLPGSLLYSLHISLDHMAIGQEITITLREVSP